MFVLRLQFVMQVEMLSRPLGMFGGEAWTVDRHLRGLDYT